MSAQFIKIEVSPNLATEIETVQKRHSGVHWSRANSLHITLVACNIPFTPQQTAAYQRIADQVISDFI